jgi:hypothetical protein
VRRRDLVSTLDDYLDDLDYLVAEVGQPSELELERADAIARRIQDRELAARAD